MCVRYLWIVDLLLCVGGGRRHGQARLVFLTTRIERVCMCREYPRKYRGLLLGKTRS